MKKYIKFYNKGIKGSSEQAYQEVTILTEHITAIQDRGNYINIWTGNLCWSITFFEVYKSTLKERGYDLSTPRKEYEARDFETWNGVSRPMAEMAYKQIEHFIFCTSTQTGDYQEHQCVKIESWQPSTCRY